MTRSTLLAAFALLLSVAPAARADVVGDPSPSCPEGAVPSATHSGPFCAPERCEDDQRCSNGERCVERSFCMERRPSGSGWSPDSTVDHVVRDSCEPACTAPSECTTARVCAPSTTDDGDSGSAPSEERSDGCSASGARGSSWLALASLAFACSRRRVRGDVRRAWTA